VYFHVQAGGDPPWERSARWQQRRSIRWVRRSMRIRRFDQVGTGEGRLCRMRCAGHCPNSMRATEMMKTIEPDPYPSPSPARIRCTLLLLTG
jgi:hypothetical protein